MIVRGAAGWAGSCRGCCSRRRPDQHMQNMLGSTNIVLHRPATWASTTRMCSLCAARVGQPDGQQRTGWSCCWRAQQWKVSSLFQSANTLESFLSCVGCWEGCGLSTCYGMLLSTHRLLMVDALCCWLPCCRAICSIEQQQLPWGRRVVPAGHPQCLGHRL